MLAWEEICVTTSWVVQQEAQGAPLAMPLLIIWEKLPHSPDNKPQENREAGIPSKDHETHGNQHINFFLECNHICIQEGHAGVVESGNA